MAWLFTLLALWRAGARARRVTTARQIDPARLDGLIIGGGADVTEMSTGGRSLPTSASTAWIRLFLKRSINDVSSGWL